MDLKDLLWVAPLALALWLAGREEKKTRARRFCIVLNISFLVIVAILLVLGKARGMW